MVSIRVVIESAVAVTGVFLLNLFLLSWESHRHFVQGTLSGLQVAVVMGVILFLVYYPLYNPQKRVYYALRNRGKTEGLIGQPTVDSTPGGFGDRILHLWTLKQQSQDLNKINFLPVDFGLTQAKFSISGEDIDVTSNTGNSVVKKFNQLLPRLEIGEYSPGSSDVFMNGVYFVVGDEPSVSTMAGSELPRWVRDQTKEDINSELKYRLKEWDVPSNIRLHILRSEGDLTIVSTESLEEVLPRVRENYLFFKALVLSLVLVIVLDFFVLWLPSAL